MRNLNTILTALALTFSTVAAVGCTTTDATSDTDDDSSLAGKFDLWQATDAQWHFHLKSGNGAILLTSEGYDDRTGAINGVLSVLQNGIEPSMYQVLPAAHGYLLHLVAPNNQIISFSQTYSTKSNATRAITSCVNATNSYLDKTNSNNTGARVEILEGSPNDYRFNLYADNGQIVLSSEHYTTPAAAWNGAYAVQDAAATPSGFVMLKSSDARFYFNVVASNGQVVGTSQMYTTQESANAGVAAVTSVFAKLTIH